MNGKYLQTNNSSFFFFSRVNISRAHANCHGIHMSLTESQNESQTDPVGDK